MASALLEEQICVTMCVLGQLHQRRAPVVGYRPETNRYSTDGVNLGARLLLVHLAAARQIFFNSELGCSRYG